MENTNLKMSHAFLVYQEENINVNDSKMAEFMEYSQKEILQQIITNFGLSSMINAYKAGGDVQTLFNFKKGVFAEEKFEQRHNEEYEHKNYEGGGFAKKRKKIFQDDTKDYVIDEYTGKKLNKDGTMHLDHVVSAKKIHDDLSLRMVTSAEERDRIATDDKNLAKTYSSLNQSKGEKDFEQWANSTNRKDKTKTNAEYYEVDSTRAQEKISIAEQHIESSRRKATYSHYVDGIKEHGINRGF